MAIDWGELTGMGPAEVEVVRFALGTCWFQADLTPGDVYEHYERHSAVGLDERLLELSMRILVPSMAIGCLGAMGACRPESSGSESRHSSSGRWPSSIEASVDELASSGSRFPASSSGNRKSVGKFTGVVGHDPSVVAGSRLQPAE